MVWAYIWAWLSARALKVDVLIPAILLLGALPDIDLFLSGFGVVHHSFTHSLLFWFILFTPLYWLLRWRAVPYLVAVMQHFVFGDFLVGSVMLFWPFSQVFFGVNLRIGLFEDVFLEGSGLLLSAILIILNGDFKRMISIRRENLFMVVPLLALLASMLFFAVDQPLVPLVLYISSRKLLTIMVTCHLILLGFLAASSIQGVRSTAVDLRKTTYG